MVNLDYYYRTDIYELDNILKKGLSYDYFKTSREYGFSLYLTDRTNINLNNKNIVVNVHMKNLNNILVVTNFQELLTAHLLPIVTTAVANVNTLSAPVSINGITLTAGDVVALGAQTAPAENGMYLFVAAAAPMEKTIDVISYVNNFGKTERLGTKYIQKFMVTNGYTGLKVTSENLLVLYDTTNIKYIKLYDSNA